MLNELKILFNNIKNFRALLTESVGDGDIIKAIQNHEYIYIYYIGDDGIQAGNRTIRPYALGKTKEGNTVLRAWQDNYKSVSFRQGGGRNEHEYWHDDLDGKEKPGWRLFRVDRISEILPTGKKFVNNDGQVIIPPKYREGADDQMQGGVIAYVSSKTPTLGVTTGDANEPDVIQRKVSAFDNQTNKWQRFYNANKSNRKETGEDIQKLYKIVKRVWRKSPNNYIVVINKKNEYEAIPITYKDKVPPETIVGGLTNLYDKLVKPHKSTKPEEDNFVRQEKDKALKNINNGDNKQNLDFKKLSIMKENEKFPFNKKTFFK
jgi:hypothetical protein